MEKNNIPKSSIEKSPKAKEKSRDVWKFTNTKIENGKKSKMNGEEQVARQKDQTGLAILKTILKNQTPRKKVQELMTMNVTDSGDRMRMEEFLVEMKVDIHDHGFGGMRYDTFPGEDFV